MANLAHPTNHLRTKYTCCKTIHWFGFLTILRIHLVKITVSQTHYLLNCLSKIASMIYEPSASRNTLRLVDAGGNVMFAQLGKFSQKF